MAASILARVGMGPQPQLRAYPILNEVPSGWVDHRVIDRDNEPLIWPGEIIIADPDDAEPCPGELFLVEYGRVTGRPARCIVEMRGAPEKGWMLGGYSRPRSLEEARGWARTGRPIVCADGPYAPGEIGLAAIREIVVGRVVGILDGAAAYTG